MGVTAYLTIIYLVLFSVTIVAFIKGKENKKWFSFITVTAIMVTGTVILAYLWITSPM